MELNLSARALVSVFAWLILSRSTSYAAESDVECLRSIKASLEDPFNYLPSWNFSKISTDGFICGFIGIECWHYNENRVLNIQLRDMGLKGEFPRGIAGCSSLTGLDLSGNHIYGNIPSNISKLIPFVTTLDLSSNQLSGKIPEDLVNCIYLNVLRLDNNKLTSRIPLSIGRLNRIKSFNVTKNRLFGQVPIFINATIPAECYADNPGLCGGPLPSCPGNL